MSAPGCRVIRFLHCHDLYDSHGAKIQYQRENMLRPPTEVHDDNDERVTLEQILGIRRNSNDNGKRITPEQTVGIRSLHADDRALRSLADAASQQNINPSELGASLPHIGVSFAPNLSNWMPSTVRPVVSSSIPPEIRSAILRNQHLLPEVRVYLPEPNGQLQGYPRTGDTNEYQFFPQQQGLNVNEINGHYFEPAPAVFQMLHRESRFSPGGNSFVMPPLDNLVTGARRNGISLDLSLNNSNSQLGLNFELFNHQLNERSKLMFAEFGGHSSGNIIPTSFNRQVRPSDSGFRDLVTRASHGPDMITGTGNQPLLQFEDVRSRLKDVDPKGYPMRDINTRNVFKNLQLQTGEAQEQEKMTGTHAETQMNKRLRAENNTEDKRNYMLEKVTAEKGESWKQDASLLCEQLPINETAKGQIASSFKEIEICLANKNMPNKSGNDCYKLPDLNLVPDDWESAEATEIELPTKLSETAAEKILEALKTQLE